MQAPSSPGIKSRILKTENVPWQKLTFLQQDTFKDISASDQQKLINSILNNELAQPFYVWEDTKTQVLYCLDGYHRAKTMEYLISQGHDIPELLPATYVYCKGKKEAAKLVLVYSSIYAKVTHSGLDDFLATYQIVSEELFGEIDLPEIDLNKFLGDVERDFSLNNDELNLDDFGDEIILKLKFSKANFLRVKEEIKTQVNLRRFSGPEELLLELLNLRGVPL